MSLVSATFFRAIKSPGSVFKVPEFDTLSKAFSGSETSKTTSLADNERNHIISVLKITGGKVGGPGGAAEILEINPSTLYSRMKKLTINRVIS